MTRERCICCDRVLAGVPAPDDLYPSICEDCWDEQCTTARCEITGVDR